MILDKLPPLFADHDLDAALRLAAEVEALPTLTGVADLGDALRQRGQSDDATPVGQLLVVDGLVCGLMLAYGPSAERWRSPLIPVWEMSGRAFPPPVEHYPDSIRPYLEHRAIEGTRADVRARYHDFLWLRWRDHAHGRAARQAYLDAARTADLEGSEGGEAIAWAIRGAELSMQLNIDRPGTASLIRNEIRRGLRATNLGYPCFLVEYAAELLATDPDATRVLVGDIEAAAMAAGSAGDRRREQSLFEACTQALRACGDMATANAFLRRTAASLETQGRERGAVEGGLVELLLLRDAARLYKDAGSSSDAQRLKADLVEAGVRAKDDLQPIGGSFEIPAATIDQWAARLVAWDEESPVSLLALPYELGIWVSWDDHRAFAAQMATEAPLSSLLHHVRISADGRTQPEPEDESARDDARPVSLYASRAMIQATIAEAVIQRLRARERWTPAALTNAIAVVDEGLATAASGGIRALELRDYWNGVHALIPQLERALRLIGQEVGANVVSYSTATGTRWRSLEDMLNEPKIRAALTEDVAIEIVALFSSPYGPNVRNAIAHGAIDPADVGIAHALLTALTLLTLTAVLAVVRAQSETAARDL